MFYYILDSDINGIQFYIPKLRCSMQYPCANGKYKTKYEALKAFKRLVEANIECYREKLEVAERHLQWVNEELKKEE